MSEEVPAKRKDKLQVIGEVFDDDRIRTFLNFLPPAGADADFHVLEKAYRGMKAENFATFLDFFLAENRNINATDVQGKTLLDIISAHPRAAAYVDALRARAAGQ
ncbi:MAG: PA4642 family protein [Porticoccaceae bacterium]